MKILVLGSAAGGGFPQWNCNCRNCAGVRAGTLKTRARTQSSIAVAGSDASSWVLINASPDVRAQLEANAALLQPGRSARDSAITAIVLADAQIDHTTGLFTLRESGRPWPVYCTDRVHEDLTRGNPIFEVLSHYCGLERVPVIPGGPPFRIDGADGVSWQALPVASKPPPFSPNRGSPELGDNIALLLRDEDSGGSLLYAPGLGEIDEHIWLAMQSVDCVLVDGTFWSDDEMVEVGVSGKRARDIGHLPQSGPGGMLEWLERLPQRTRRILIHINNTNPILDERSAERVLLAERGVEVAWDGMEIYL
jgi:pyrroloquinoline quinone biosynthesis protein B